MDFNSISSLTIPNGQVRKIEVNGTEVWEAFTPQVNSEVAYSKVVPSNVQQSSMLSGIGGKTIVWNQLIQNSTEQTIITNGITFVTKPDGSITANGTATANAIKISATLNLTIQHKYLFMGCPSGGTLSTHAMTVSDNAIFTVYDYGSGAIFTNNSTLQVNAVARVYSGYTATNLIFRPQLFDLTQMFGAGNEPTTVEQFKAMFPNDYYPYDSGTLLSGKVDKIISQNSENNVLQEINIPTEIQNLTGYGWSAGSVYNEVDWVNKKYIQRVNRIMLNGTQTLSATNWRPTDTTFAMLYPYSLTNNRVNSDVLSMGNYVADKFEAKTFGEIYDGAVGIGVTIETNNGICLRVPKTIATNYIELNAWLSANQITFYYELATPIETDISAYLTDNNLIEVESGGSITFEQQNDTRLPVPNNITFKIDLP